MRLLILLCIAIPLMLAIALDIVCRIRWTRNSSIVPWYSGVAGTLIDIWAGFPIAVAMTLFLFRIRVFGDGLVASAYGVIATPAVGYVFFVLSTVLIPLLSCWLQVQWASIASHRKWTAAALLAGAIVLHFVFVETGSGTYTLLQPPHEAWFAWLGEVYGEVRTASMFWFAPRFAGEGYGGSICLVFGIITPVVAGAGALFSLLTGRRSHS